MDQAEGEGGWVFTHHHIEAISGNMRQSLKGVFAAATTENEE